MCFSKSQFFFSLFKNECIRQVGWEKKKKKNETQKPKQKFKK